MPVSSQPAATGDATRILAPFRGIGPPAGRPPAPRRSPTMAGRFNRKPLTDAERDARRQADRDRIEQAARAL